MALITKSSDTAVVANAVIALQEHIEMGNKASENIRNNLEIILNFLIKPQIALIKALKKK